MWGGSVDSRVVGVYTRQANDNDNVWQYSQIIMGLRVMLQVSLRGLAAMLMTDL